MVLLIQAVSHSINRMIASQYVRQPTRHYADCVMLQQTSQFRIPTELNGS